MPPRSSKRQSANQHNAKHENGLAQPGRKVEKGGNKDKSANGHATSNITDGGPLPASRPGHSPPTINAHHSPSAGGARAQSTSVDVSARGERVQVNETGGRPGTESPSPGAAAVSTDAARGGMVVESVEPQHRRIDVNVSQNPAVHQGIGAIRLVSTILKACPLADTIAILIILLQIPPTVLTVIHLLFATLTFVPPSGAATSAFPSLSDVFQGTTGTPSLATIALADIVFLVIWLFLWAPAQKVAFDFAQAVIAISLGGGYTGRGGGTQSAASCLGVIVMTQAARRKGLRPASLDFISSAMPSSTPNGSAPMHEFDLPASRTYTNWLQSILTVHILTQGVVKVVRRWLSRRESRVNVNVTALTRTETDTAGHALAQTEASTPTTNVNTVVQAGNNAVGPPLASPKDGKDKMSSGKRKRKQSTQVRSQQPFWAALASTKVIVLKEYELSVPPAEAIAAGATDADNLGNAAYGSEEMNIWITHIGPTEIFFETDAMGGCRPPTEGAPGNDDRVEGGMTTGVDRSKAFYIRINGANWASTKIHEGNADADMDHGDVTVAWTGEIFGLAPSSNYECQFVRSVDDVAVCCTSVTTPPVPAPVTGKGSLVTTSLCADQGLTASASASIEPVPPPVVPKSLRPSSPVSTLRKSTAAAEGKLQEEKAALKRTRKEHKSQTSSLKKDVDGISARLATSGAGDDRYRQRVLQISQHIRQAEETTDALAVQIDEMGGIPKEDSRRWRAKRESWEQARYRHSKTQGRMHEEKAQMDRRVAAVQAEATSVHQKRERLQTRLSKLNEQHDRITDANAQGLNERERRAEEDAARRKEREAQEASYQEQIVSMHRTVKETSYGSQQLWQQIHTIETAYREQQRQHQAQQQQQAQQAQQAQHPQLSMLTSASSPLPATTSATFGQEILPPIGRKHASNASTSSNGTANNSFNNGFVFPSFASTAPPPPPVPPLPAASFMRDANRGRSSSMRSSGSGFTDYVDAPMTSAPRPEVTSVGEAATASANANGAASLPHEPSGSDRDASGSGSGSGSGASQREEPASPAAVENSGKRVRIKQTPSPGKGKARMRKNGSGKKGGQTRPGS